ncbi:unnamed protein product [Sphagnum jensenii]|uniref:Uncharacterized protein n=1 Tax=Sphagnum jensenii TaxID=128206 RepID=A0ABP1A6I4_9BRYO
MCCSICGSSHSICSHIVQTFLKNGLSRFHYGYFWPILFQPFQYFNLHQHYQTSFGVKLRYGSENFQGQVAKYLCSILGGKVPFSMNESHLEEVLTTPGRKPLGKGCIACTMGIKLQEITTNAEVRAYLTCQISQ